MALTAKQNKQLIYLFIDYVRNTSDDGAVITYYQQLMASDTFALSEIANYIAKVAPTLDSQLSTLTNLDTPITAKKTALS